MVGNLVVEIDYGDNSSLLIEGLGPWTVIGIVKDAVLSHFHLGGRKFKTLNIRQIKED